jgi:hypothetical protein
MRSGDDGTIIVTVTTRSKCAVEVGKGRYLSSEMAADAVPKTVPILVTGEPVAGQALVLLLQGPRYDPTFFPVSAWGEWGPREGFCAILLAPTPGLTAVHRETFAHAIVSEARRARVPILKLGIFGDTGDGQGCAATGSGEVAWRCSIEELERRIEGALYSEHAACQTTSQPLPGQEELVKP